MGNGRQPATSVVTYSAPPGASRSRRVVKRPPRSQPAATSSVHPGAKAPTANEEIDSLEPGDPETTSETASFVAAPDPGEPIETAALPPRLDRADGGIVMWFGDRRYRVRGLEKNTSFGVLRLNVLATREHEMLFGRPRPLAGFFVDTLDLYSARQRAAFEKQAAHELGVKDEIVKRDLGQLLPRARGAPAGAASRRRSSRRTRPSRSRPKSGPTALELLSRPEPARPHPRRLRAGAASSARRPTSSSAISRPSRRKLERAARRDRPVELGGGQSRRSWKRSSRFVPEEEREKYSAMTGQSLFYMSARRASSTRSSRSPRRKGPRRRATR